MGFEYRESAFGEDDEMERLMAYAAALGFDCAVTDGGESGGVLSHPLLGEGSSVAWVLFGEADGYFAWECLPDGGLSVLDFDEAVAELLATFRWVVDRAAIQADDLLLNWEVNRA